MASNVNDIDSPGFEYLRSYQNMVNLYYKLIALDYQRDFCLPYKFPRIDKHYFSIPSKNQSQQQYLYQCLCAWLIKEKCQMNLELDPQEYQDPDSVVAVILEAISLLLMSDEGGRSTFEMPTISPARLKQGYGPEVIWTMNLLADRALEFSKEINLPEKKTKIFYCNTNSQGKNEYQDQNFITIGQPVVGGGLTTRPLGTYQVDDPTLLIETYEEENSNNLMVEMTNRNDIDRNEWLTQVEAARRQLESKDRDIEPTKFTDWSNNSRAVKKSIEGIREFASQSRSLLEVASADIDSQLQTLSSRGVKIRRELGAELDNYLDTWRNFSKLKIINEELVAQVDAKTDEYEKLDANISSLNYKIQSRKKELKDKDVLRDLAQVTEKLKAENKQSNREIGLLLIAYGKLHQSL